MELEELHVLQGNALPVKDAQALARCGEGVGGRPEDPAEAARGNEGCTRMEDVNLTGLYLDGDDAPARAVGDHDVEDVELGEELNSQELALLEEGEEDGMAGAVRRVAGPPDRRLAELPRVPAEPPLGDLALPGPREGNTQVLQFHDGADGVLAHDLDGVLVAEEVAPLGSVIEMPFRRVRLLVSEGRADAALRRAGMGPGGVEFGENSHRARLLRLDGRPEARKARADDDGIKPVFRCHESSRLRRSSRWNHSPCPVSPRRGNRHGRIRKYLDYILSSSCGQAKGTGVHLLTCFSEKAFNSSIWRQRTGNSTRHGYPRRRRTWRL
jgi:hypothetical protein